MMGKFSSAFEVTSFIIVRSGTTARCVCLLFLVLLLGMLATPSFAQDNLPPWRKNLDCDSEVQKYSGVEYCTGLDGNAHVLVIDLHQPGVRLEYVIAEGLDRNKDFGECRDVNIPQWSKGSGCYDPLNSNYYPVMSLLDAVKRNSNAAAVINSDYGAGTQDEPKSREHGPEGFTVVRGSRLDGPAVNDTDNNAERRPWLAVGEDSPLKAKFDQFPSGEDDGGKPDWVYTGVGGAPWLIREGRIEEDQIKSCTNANPRSCTSTVAQTAVALSEDGRWLYWVVVVGRDAEGTAQFLHDALRPQQAIKMDGGGSSQFWYGGLPGATPKARVVYAGDGRRLSQYMAVFAESGSGIIIEPEPEPPDQPGWWERIWQNIRSEVEEWWEQRKADLAEWWEQRKVDLAEWWEQRKADFVEWLETQLQEYLNELCGQVCGTAMLPGGMVLLLWVRRGRRR